MRKSCYTLTTILLFIAISGTSFAQKEEQDAKSREFLKTLGVSLSDKCRLVDRLGKDDDGPYQRTDYCNEKELMTVKTFSGVVYRVVDGDTVHFFANKKLYAIRMLGIDTAELHYQGMAQPAWGVTGRDSLRAMIKPGDKITVELDQVKCDRYGRLLAHVFKNGLNLNFEQVRRGQAVNYCIAPNLKHCSTYSLAYRKARAEGLGFHTDSCLVTPYVWRRAMDLEAMNKKVMDTRTNTFYSPDQYYLVPVEYRIFYPTGE